MRILLASAGDCGSLGALHVVHALAQRESVQVRVLAVATPFPHAAGGVRLAPAVVIDADNRRETVDLVRTQIATLPGTEEWPVDGVVGFPADRIVTTAEAWPASLIVMGHGEHNMLDRLLGSETAVAVARRSRVPVLAVPEDVRALPERAAAAIDFTDASVAAASLAATLLPPNGVLTLVHASTLVKEGADPGSLTDMYTAGAKEKLAAIRDRIRRHSKRSVHTTLMSGKIVESLLAFIERDDAHLLALGGHDMGLADRLLLGSVRTKVLRHAQCPVLIVAHGDESKQATRGE